jgi:uncharacterized protein with NRDE domain
MCIIYFAFDQHPDNPLILIANRDEFYERPSAAASYWEDFPYIYGGRDLQGSGTWLGVTKNGRFSAVTNYRDPSAPLGTQSRGNLAADFLKSEKPAREYLAEVESHGHEYSGFNLLVGEINERCELFYYSNRGEGILELSAGVYGLSNHLLDTPWPKVEKGKARFADLLRSGETSNKNFFDILSDESLAAEEDLPSTGIPFEAEKAISAIFIKTPGYGTRCSTVLRFDSSLEWSFEERVFV